ncbi:MAG: hypothetical protein PHI27_06495 [Eubacteriales bacterium]|nr:hypothetical protein [Eubacteriales bacterium]MDD4512870.1 hypothetical protein [Eubacteriales bacterium]
MAQYTIDNRDAPIDFEIDGIIPRTIQNAKNLLMCHKGEVPYDRLRGFDPTLYDLPMQELSEALLPELDRVMMWEPDAEVVSAECSLDANGEVYIRAVIEINIEG